MLHVAVAAHAEGAEEKQGKRNVVERLLRLGFILDDTNLDGKTCRDFCPANFVRDMQGE